MALYSVDVKLFTNIEVEADSEERAREIAEAWVEWTSPTAEQLRDYLDDHPVAINTPGVFGIDGISEVEEA